MAETILILAAGEGSRLRPITDDKPKALVQVNERPLLEWQLEALNNAGYAEDAVYVVGGHRVSAIRSWRIVPHERIMVFEDYARVNNIGTLAYALEELEPPILVVNSDTLFDARHLSAFERSSHESEILYDPSTPPRSEAMKIVEDGGKLLRIAKDLPRDGTSGEYIGLTRIGTESYPHLLETSRKLARQRPDAWYEHAIDETCDKFTFRCRSIGQLPWIEIDDHDDLYQAQEIGRTLSSTV